jgi:hypothetical protein
VKEIEMKPTVYLIVAACLALAGCATLSAEDCRAIDWYWIGEYDAEVSANLIGDYTVQCAAFDVQPDLARYVQGRARGLWVRRVDHLHYTP